MQTGIGAQHFNSTSDSSGTTEIRRERRHTFKYSLTPLFIEILLVHHKLAPTSIPSESGPPLVELDGATIGLPQCDPAHREAKRDIDITT